jgi:hypothetical protein
MWGRRLREAVGLAGDVHFLATVVGPAVLTSGVIAGLVSWLAHLGAVALVIIGLGSLLITLPLWLKAAPYWGERHQDLQVKILHDHWDTFQHQGRILEVALAPAPVIADRAARARRLCRRG